MSSPSLSSEPLLFTFDFSRRGCGGHTARNGVFFRRAGESTKTHPRPLHAIYRLVLMDVIIIKGLEVNACVGVSDEERRNSQRLQIDATLTPLAEFSALADDISCTVDYHAVARRILSVAASRPRHLIETLASDIAETLVGEFCALRAEVEVRKFVLPDTEYVAVRCACDRQAE
jgi:7,8-dihydroneopterin aldolase/epimerase/oxygenase